MTAGYSSALRLIINAPFTRAKTDRMQRELGFRTKMAIGALAACMAGLVCTPWDVEVYKFVSSLKIPGDIRKGIGLSETFAHTSGTLVIFATLLWIDVKNRPQLYRAAIFALICGVTANAAKMLIPRYRPHTLEESEIEILSSWQTWGVPWTGSWSDEQFRSFPSGHSATAVAMAIGLTYVYPRGKWIFITLAVFACFQRLESSAHFLSDIMAGSAIAMLISIWYWKPTRRWNRENDRDASRFAPPPNPPPLTTE
jgi:membrane-associated phospholipid phosphatase